MHFAFALVLLTAACVSMWGNVGAGLVLIALAAVVATIGLVVNHNERIRRR
jgi:hypothetical protein